MTTTTPPPNTVTYRGRCTTGNPVCGSPARLYPCGYRCDEHQPARTRQERTT